MFLPHLVSAQLAKFLHKVSNHKMKAEFDFDHFLRFRAIPLFNKRGRAIHVLWTHSSIFVYNENGFMGELLDEHDSYLTYNMIELIAINDI